MKTAESRKLVLGSCIIDFDEIQVQLMVLSLNLNICKVMLVFLKFWPTHFGQHPMMVQAAQPADSIR